MHSLNLTSNNVFGQTTSSELTSLFGLRSETEMQTEARI